MELRIYTLHAKQGRDMEAIPDRFDLLALLFPPIWAIWNRLWVTLFGLFAVMLVAASITPLAVTPVMYGVALIFALEGGSIRRAELRLHGWTEVGVVQAATEEGAEELFVNRAAA